MMTFFPFAVDQAHVWEMFRELGLTKPPPNLALDSDTVKPGHNVATAKAYTLAEIEAHKDWPKHLTIAPLRGGERSESNFVISGTTDFEVVWQWFLSLYPKNDNTDEPGILDEPQDPEGPPPPDPTWNWRDGVVDPFVAEPGTLPDSNPDADGRFPIMFDEYLSRIDLLATFPREEWCAIQLEGPNSFVQAALLREIKSSNRSGVNSAFYVKKDKDTGAVLWGIKDPADGPPKLPRVLR